MKSFFKKIPQKQLPSYSPVALVRQHGDFWHAFIDGIHPRTSLAIKDQTDDSHDAFLMYMMERGLRDRIQN